MADVAHLTGAAACADALDLVDQAYTRPGGPEAKQLVKHYCPGCPLAADCLDIAMHHREWGVWGGTTPKVRTQHGAPSSVA